MKKYANALSENRKYLRCNMMGNYEIAFLPISGGMDEQDAEWVDEIEIIIAALNRVNS
ncbi:MAG: hypothetical protein ACRC0F_07720 [Cetobacterium sp.]